MVPVKRKGSCEITPEHTDHREERGTVREESERQGRERETDHSGS
jgi:hypothetical protein